MVVYGKDSKCFSVEPVLRCLPGCSPVKTTPVTVGYHCVATGESTTTTRLTLAGCVLISFHFFVDSNFIKSEVLRDIHEKSIDLMEGAEAHLACSCTAQCI